MRGGVMAPPRKDRDGNGQRAGYAVIRPIPVGRPVQERQAADEDRLLAAVCSKLGLDVQEVEG
jgi:hypothetical protein